MIEAIGLGKTFGRNVALQDATFRVAKGEVAAFLGMNGAGKTTTLRILTGFLPPTSGRARIGESEIGPGNGAVCGVGYLPERMPLYAEMRVGGYLRYAAAMKGLAGGEARREVGRVLERSGADVVADRRIAGISHGYRRRVGLAQALLGDPPVLLLDEPTAGLDPEQAAELRALISALAGKVTVLLSTHILEEASRICSKVIILHEGRVAAIDTPNRLRDRVGQGGYTLVAAGDVEAIRAGLLSLGAAAVRVGDEEGEGRCFDIEFTASGEEGPGIARVVADAKGRLFELKKRRPSLEEVFLRLTGRGGSS